MATANEKYIELLKLLNNCREKLDGLCSLFVANYKESKEDRRKMGEVYESTSSLHSETKQLANGNKKGSKLIIKSIKSKSKYRWIKLHQLLSPQRNIPAFLCLFLFYAVIFRILNICL